METVAIWIAVVIVVIYYCMKIFETIAKRTSSTKDDDVYNAIVTWYNMGLEAGKKIIDVEDLQNLGLLEKIEVMTTDTTETDTATAEETET